MIIDKEVEVLLSNRSIPRYKKLGYTIPKYLSKYGNKNNGIKQINEFIGKNGNIRT